MTEVSIRLPARPYQKGLIDYFRGGGRKACEVWHRRAGKDRVATFIESELSMQRVGLYWHALPEYSHARRVIWDNITRDGERLIDLNFPPEIVRKRNEQEMKMELVNGSIWQLVGADNFNALVGSNPVHVTFSEFSLMSPRAHQFISPILAENSGSELYIFTPRGFNHAHDLYQHAKRTPGWHHSLLRAEDTGVIPAEVLEQERARMPDELYRQEYECDFSAANVGAILGRYLEDAERAGRIGDAAAFDPSGAEVQVSCDIGFRDTAAFWFWQPRPDGFALIDYDEDTGLDAGDWVERLRDRYPYAAIWLPHDARAKTFGSKRSALEQFQAARIARKIDIVPSLSKGDRINAARVVLRNCWFNAARCADGLEGLRNWSFEFNQETRIFSKEPRHDWASHPGDGFSYGAIVMRQQMVAEPKRAPDLRGPATIGELIAAAERKAPARARI